jgi:hypothetical protein
MLRSLVDGVRLCGAAANRRLEDTAMARQDAHHLLAVILASGISICVAGCTELYPFEVRGTIKGAADGKPISGVNVSAKCAQSEVFLKDPNAPSVTVLAGTSTVSAQDGTFSLRFDVDAHALSSWPRWSLILRKQGYAEEGIDISPDDKAEKQRIVVAAYMKSQP